MKRSHTPEHLLQVAPEEHIPTPSKDDLLFLPMGGSGEIGMNVNLYGTNKHWIMVDLGIAFGSEECGMSFLTANLEIMRLSKIGKYLKGVIITHGHEDHIGGVHAIWPLFKFHIYCTKFSKEILLSKLEDTTYKKEIEDYYLHEIPASGNFKLGDFDITYLGITHSIPESNGLFIKTPHGNIFHTGDWKLDPGPIVGEPINENRFRMLAEEQVDYMICDSTNARTKGRAGSEEDLVDTFTHLFKNKRVSQHRIAVACFASNIARVKSVADIARSMGRKVCLLGRSLHRMTQAAEKCDLGMNLDQFIEEDKALHLKPHQVMYVCTGSQGDENAALARIARGVHRVKFEPGDTVFFSSRTIPGNEGRINKVMNNLIRLGCHIVTEKDAHIHVSGHPCRDELVQMYEWVKPKCLLPVHGEMIHLVEHARLARRHKIETLIPENGTLISLKKKKILRRYDIGRWGYDGNRFIDMGSPIIKERIHMGTEGCVFITLSITQDINLKDIVITFVGLFDEGMDRFKHRIKDMIREVFNGKDKEGKPFKNKPNHCVHIGLLIVCVRW